MSLLWGPLFYGCLLHVGWAAETGPVYVALNDPVLLNIPEYPNAEKDQVTWKDGNNNTIGKFLNSSSYKQRTVCECELFRNGSLYLKRLDTVGNETYRVEVFNQSGKSITTASLLVTVIEKVSAPRLNSSCSPDGLALIGCEIQGGTDPQYSWLENGVNLSTSWNVSGNWISGFAPVPVNISCCVWNPVSEERSQLVSVFCPIPVSVPTLNVSCQRDGSARILCWTDSGTDPVFSWSLNGTDKQGSPLNQSWSQISIVPPPAVGNILCVVSNNISLERNTMNFSCPVPLSDPVLGVSCESEERALLTCGVLSGTDPSYSWYINDTLIGNSSLHWEVNGNNLTVSLPSPGNISCTVTNPISSRNVSVSSVSCTVPVSDPVLEVSCLTNGSALVSCKVESGTNPFYSLIYNGKTVYENSSSPLVNVSLPLSSPGNISCSVRNRFSTKETGVQGRYCPVKPCSHNCLQNSIIVGVVTLLVTTLPLVVGCVYSMPRPTLKA
ncbi:Fc receptor-like protein 5 isoform X1 [Xenopus laevis]|uniref:Fc receptor-like protein 5 isoform X1 n=1 Tax=Xenopus laevis TaxID=8355 RepID=A0A8J1M6H7_XENLA|nr:Fc receptor-like protein 5 isoform X1 [Xenopus laevis]